jgi:hypothetical protein
MVSTPDVLAPPTTKSAATRFNKLLSSCSSTPSDFITIQTIGSDSISSKLGWRGSESLYRMLAAPLDAEAWRLASGFP